MEARLKREQIGGLMLQVGPLWRAALLLAAVKCSVRAEEGGTRAQTMGSASFVRTGGSGGKDGIEGRDGQGEGEGEGKLSYRQAALQVSDYIQSAGLSEIYLQAPPLDGEGLRRVLPGIPHGPPFRLVMDAQVGIWLREPDVGGAEMGSRLREAFPEYG